MRRAFTQPLMTRIQYLLLMPIRYKNSGLKQRLDKQSPKFGQACVFLSTMKAIMAKLHIADWSSLDDSMVRIRVSTLRFFIKKAIAWGAEEIEPTIEFLKV
ncbi:hypothetical protein BC937DRAFT_86553 [Endogone sp. FLAS-F59071]|nr:hypothetical protein BC937DRAFT_86553 [Endogone sp. FLAS-F59071]|eukprot:RUS20016.1 hypothetical protein BC937DRAFT_86553 [Endogone sp. FLAS-F59071]